MNTQKLTRYLISLLIFISCLFSLDLFLHKGEAATFDGPTHITTMYQVAQVIKNGEFPVTWLQNFAHYGSPIPMYAHQTTMYLGALLTLITGSVLHGYAITVFLATIVGALGMYIALRNHFSVLASWVGACVFVLAPYRILNIYARGAIPEYAAQSLIPIIMFLIFKWHKTKRAHYFILLTLSFALLALTHPFMLVIATPLLGLYCIFITQDDLKKMQSLGWIGGSLLLGLGIAGYFLVPLVTEVRYLVYGMESNHYKPGQFLSLANYVRISWPFLTEGDRFTRPHTLLGGFWEGLILFWGIGYVLLKKQTPKYSFAFFAVISAVIYIFFTLPVSEIFYTHLKLLGNIQHPWRMLAGYSVTIPLLIAFGIDKVKHKELAVIVVIGIMCIVRIPELYGKNYTYKSPQTYAYTRDNLHGFAMNSIWMAETTSYPDFKQPTEFIEGKGSILPHVRNNTYRAYTVDAQEPVRMVEYTFYFPGWVVVADGKPVNIEFQDMNYRGFITYRLPPGKHEVILKFTPTRKRLAGYGLSAISLLILAGIYVKLRSKLIN